MTGGSTWHLRAMVARAAGVGVAPDGRARGSPRPSMPTRASSPYSDVVRGVAGRGTRQVAGITSPDSLLDHAARRKTVPPASCTPTRIRTQRERGTVSYPPAKRCCVPSSLPAVQGSLRCPRWLELVMNLVELTARSENLGTYWAPGEVKRAMGSGLSISRRHFPPLLLVPTGELYLNPKYMKIKYMENIKMRFAARHTHRAETW